MNGKMSSIPLQQMNDAPPYDKAPSTDLDLQARPSTTALLTSPSDISINHMPNKSVDHGSPLTKSLVLLALACSLTFFLSGYHNVVLNAPSEVIEAWINQTYCGRQNISAEACNGSLAGEQTKNMHERFPSTTSDLVNTETRTRLIYAFATGAFAGGGALGSALGGALADRIGRRKALIAAAVFMLMSSPLMSVAGYLYSPELLIVGHFLVGCAVGSGGVVSIMYVVEASPRSIRGQISICNQFGTVVGFVLSQILGVPVLFGAARRWPILFLVTLFAPILQILLLLTLPDSPRYLFITKRDKDAARASVKRLNNGDVGDEMRELEEEVLRMDEKQTKLTYRRFLTERKYVRPLMVAIVMHLSMIWGGIMAIIAYSSILFRQAGLGEQAGYANLAGGALFIIMSFVAIKLIERYGRKTLHLTGLAGMIVFGLFTTVCAVLATDENGLGPFRISEILAIMFFVIFYAVGPASIPWVIVGELFEQESRSLATSIVLPVNWLSQLGTLILFLWLLDVIGGYTFLPFMCLIIIFFVFLLKYMPETKGLTFGQISEKFK